MASFFLPKTWCEHVDSLFKNFWWSFNNRINQHFTPVARNRISLPKELGGCLSSLAFLYKSSSSSESRVDNFTQQPHKLQVQLMKAKYFRSENYLRASVGRNSPCVWQGMMQIRDLLLKGLCYVLRDSLPIDLCNNAWLLGEGYDRPRFRNVD